MAKGLGSASFDARGINIAGKSLSSALPVGQAQKGGIVQARKDRTEKRRKRSEELKVGEHEGLKQALNREEAALQGLMDRAAGKFEELDRKIKDLREKKADAAQGSQQEKDLAAEIAAVEAEKKEVKEGKTGILTADGKSISQVGKKVRERKLAVDEENRKRMRRVAQTMEGKIKVPIPIIGGAIGAVATGLTKVFVPGRGGQANSDAAHQIRMGVKLDSEGKH